ncbi:3'-5' exonuclease [Ponticoccus sp. SC2-23]|uniref:3'-5' exonuclease n=1 Tax=Alexandriicola marinus TaxID=2081710 RepID=UPI000FD997D9|nr:3'-5' exonuclease [Alexandriicola marinus]MBM1218687.1 3'-5' exonuclease [Ponticoccus sp. SC6-9]MBM1224241.1 3'-5' exonuclease [Ponticoccus sp. SC6-15]MBM1229980.1 3'-5' exonuclease [Ponticoccus sp. SC6-38]MBM1233207.1 3'-5' exonuclease [Ponticoccus sp. SC6-45]MBM1236843.1 3'-5' exonuclease [Ponticoccus sp. SC6-49]MBM1242218.1 3'-5' exonuclease [Ponticoccus sp. SC2-64]MBM1246731.1 3'-5' exonuclease [Ponticoccus sp. SC6-42]MBM1251209.1 3'-5' exonuclease [Ponticoccus sp. SC6-33]MBM1254852
MLTSLSLRLRIFLFFCLLALGGAALAAAALYLGWSRAEEALPSQPFVTVFIVFAFLNTGLALGVWLLFDENVAKPINRLSAGLRLRAHSDVEAEVDRRAARYLGDLAPAAEALTRTMNASVMDSAAQIARETQRLRRESERLTALLTEIPIATILLNPANEIVLYDAQAAEVLAGIAPPRLKAAITEYFDEAEIASAIGRLSDGGGEVALTLCNSASGRTFDARIKVLGDDGHMILIDMTGVARPVAPRPLVFDFDLLDAAQSREVRDTPLRDLCFVAFDTETTGLSVEKDAIVQIGAVRILNGRIVEGEAVDCYVNPGMPIPPASTRIHKVTDEDVAGAPGIAEAGRALHHFARDAVLVAHNAPFDVGLLKKSEAEIGVRWSHPVLDTVLLSSVVFGINEPHSLDALCDRLSITIPPELRHTAMGDARATGEALVRLLPILEGMGFRTFGALVDETRKHGRLLRDLNE